MPSQPVQLHHSECIVVKGYVIFAVEYTRLVWLAVSRDCWLPGEQRPVIWPQSQQLDIVTNRDGGQRPPQQHAHTSQGSGGPHWLPGPAHPHCPAPQATGAQDRAAVTPPEELHQGESTPLCLITPPSYNCTGWLGIKHQVTYLHTATVLFLAAAMWSKRNFYLFVVLRH